LRKATDKLEDAPGFFEGDTVAHCGPTLKGEFARTLNLTDMHIGWVFTRTVRNNAHTHILGGLVFAFTMAALVVNNLRIVGQGGTTIGLGLLVDTLVVRSLMTPSIAAMLGRWFWWPLPVRSRPAYRRAAANQRIDDADTTKLAPLSQFGLDDVR
jgi:hypothetical protein